MKFNVSFSRTSNSEAPYKLNVMDDGSRVQFELNMTAEQFAEAMTGLYTTDVEGSVLGDPSNIGKTKVREERSIYLKGRGCERETVRQYIKDNYQEDGWHLDLYLGSQQSMVYDGKDGYTINYAVYKWV